MANKLQNAKQLNSTQTHNGSTENTIGGADALAVAEAMPKKARPSLYKKKKNNNKCDNSCCASVGSASTLRFSVLSDMQISIKYAGK